MNLVVPKDPFDSYGKAPLQLRQSAITSLQEQIVA